MLYGGAGDDWLFGDVGVDADYIAGQIVVYYGATVRGGNDLLVGGDGSNHLFGDARYLTVFGPGSSFQCGNAVLAADSVAPEASDELFGDAKYMTAESGGFIAGGDDVLQGGDGSDVLVGDGAEMYAYGGSIVTGKDQLSGGGGADDLFGDAVTTYVVDGSITFADDVVAGGCRE